MDNNTNKRKDELLELIQKYTNENILFNHDKAIEEETIKEKKDLAEQLEKALAEVKKEYDSARSNYNSSSYTIDSYKRKITSNNERIDRAKRELSRIRDAERINEEYFAQLKALQDASLNAPWRKENRTDGQGLFKHQIEGAIQMAVAKQGLLADKRGTGKTGTLLAWLDLVEAKKVIVISPGDTMDNFIQETKLWTPHRNPYKLGKMPKAQRSFVISALKGQAQFMVILNFEAWRRDTELINDLIDLQADTLVIDEAHHAKTLNTHVQKGIQALRFGINTCPGCLDPNIIENGLAKNHYNCANCGHSGFVLDFCTIKNVLPTTGTPILNKPQELFPQLKLIDLKNFNSEKNFLADFCQQDYYTKHWRWRNGAEKDVMKKIGPRYLSRDRQSAGVEIPPMQHILHTIEWDDLQEKYPNQAKAYRQARDYAQIVMDQTGDVAMNIREYITVLLRLRQVVTWPAAIELRAKDPVTKEPFVVAKLDIHESAKLDKAQELIEEIVEEGERVVVFSQFKQPFRELQKRLVDNDVMTAIYDGDTPNTRRYEIQQDFDARTAPDNPQWDVVLGNYKAMGEGLNFTAASQMVILDEEWNPGKQEQAYGRIDRMGQIKNTQIHTIRVEKTVDTWMAGLIEEKAQIVDGFEVAGETMMQKFKQALEDGEL